MVLTILKQVMEEKLSSTNVEIATVSVNEQTKKPTYKLYEKAEIDEAMKDVTV